MIGKWHLGWDFATYKKAGGGEYDWSLPLSGGPTSHGFDRYFGDGTINFPPYAWMENDRFTAVPSEPLPIKELEKSLRFEGRLELRSGPAVPGWDIMDVSYAPCKEPGDHQRIGPR